MLDISDKKVVKECFADWLDIQDQRKQLNDSNKELLGNAATILEVKTTTVNKLFTFMKKRIEDGQDELDVISTLSTEIDD